MQDYWNDPPEYPEVPECCGEEMEADGKLCRCFICGKVIEDPPDWTWGTEQITES
jgi:hypothetical protein